MRILTADPWLSLVIAVALRPYLSIEFSINFDQLPSFMSPLMVTELSLAGACPLVRDVSPPTWDERGVWLDADLRYDGGAHIAILTQINLMKLKEKSEYHVRTCRLPPGNQHLSPKR